MMSKTTPYPSTTASQCLTQVLYLYLPFMLGCRRQAWVGEESDIRSTLRSSLLPGFPITEW